MNLRCLTSTILLFTLGTICPAQAPDAFSYQGVARGAGGEPITNTTIGVQFQLHQATAGGTVVYSETHTPITNGSGLFDVEVGNGTPTSGAFAAIDWKAGPYFLEVGLDPTGGSSYANMGTQQLLSVPYALHANTADSLSTRNWERSADDLHNTNPGNVGIGTNDPQFPIEVLRTSDGTIGHFETTGTGWGGVNIKTADAASGFVRFEDGNSSAAIKHQEDNLILEAPDNTPRMFVDGSTGNVGIGTTTPTAPLTLSRDTEATTGQLELSQTSGITDGNFDGLFFTQRLQGQPATSLGSFRLVNKGIGYPDLAFYTRQNGTNGEVERVRINNEGSMGIGTGTPEATLHVSDQYNSGNWLKISNHTNSWGSPGNFNAVRFIQTSSGANDSFKQFNVGAGGLSLGYSAVPVYGSADAMYVNGRVGIGTITPDAKLTIGTPGQTWTDYGLTTDSRIGVVNGPGSRMAAILTSSGSGGVLESFDYASGTLAFTLINPNGGNVGIGTTTPQSKLAVNGKITCKEVEVTLANFPDYVFETNYDLMTLEQLEAYIKEYGHLPNVPSACEVEENGLGLGEMNKILLEKVEELTLHLIEKDKVLMNVIDRVRFLENGYDQLNIQTK